MPDSADQLPVISYASGIQPPRWATFLIRPVRWPTFTISGCIFVLFLYGCSVPFGYVIPLVLCFYASFFLGFILFVRFLIRVVILRIYRKIGEPVLHQGWRWCVHPALAVLGLLLGFAQIPQTIMFSFSRPAMEKLARDAAAGGKLPNRQVGWYYATDIEAIPGGGVHFYIDGAGLFERHGFAYVPPGATPPPDPPYHLIPFSGYWYTFQND